MLNHYLLLIFRNFRRYKSTFFINLIGLSTGLACALLIFLWVNDELQVDRFHEKDRELYRVMANHHHTDLTNTIPDVPGLLAPALKAEFPEVEMAVPTMSGSINGMELFNLEHENRHFKALGRFAGTGFFELFSYPLLAGNQEQVLADKHNIVISESLARNIFGTVENSIGQPLKWELFGYSNEVLVAGVFRDVPAASSERFDFVMPFTFFEEELLGKERVHWYNFYAYAYLSLKEGTDVAAFNTKIEDFIRGKADQSNVTLFVVPYAERYLYGNYENGRPAGGRIEYVRLFSIIALCILFIACINFMNLSTAKASRRSREVGVRKTVGASRSSLVVQYMGESVLLALVALLVALVLVVVLLPQFNTITDKQLSLPYNAGFVLTLLATTVLTGLLAGSYPALYLSGFRPVRVLKGHLKASFSELWVRKGLVVFQFCISLVLIVAVLIIYRQIEYIQDKNLGLNRDNVISMEMRGQVYERKETFLSQVEQIPGIVRVAASSLQLGKGHWTQGIDWEGKPEGADFTFGEIDVSAGLIETLDIRMAEGRAFSDQYATDSTGIVFNQAAIDIMGLENPIGKTVRHYTGDKHIVGVVEDFHVSSLHEKVRPAFMLLRPERTTHVMVRVAAGKASETLDRLQQLYGRFNPGYPFEFTFLDEDYQALYAAEQRVSALSRYFAILAVLISCLGLFGLITFAAEQRTKEIGIRKVLGASVANIVGLLTADFLKLVLVAIVLATPLAYYAAQQWLQNFAYHIDVQWWVFALAGVLALLIAFLTVGYQSLRAALTTPTESLRSE